MSSKPKLSKADRREAIVAAASRLFAERGFRGVTTRELAQSVGVTEPVLYEHFATKNDLYAAIIDGSSHQQFVKAKAILDESAAKDDPKTFFLKLARLICEHVVKNPAYMRLKLFSALENHEMSRLCFERHGMEAYRIVGGYIQKRIEAGEFNPVDPILAAQAFMGMVTQYSLFDQHFGFKIVRTSRKRALEGIVEIFFNGISAK